MEPHQSGAGSSPGQSMRDTCDLFHFVSTRYSQSSAGHEGRRICYVPFSNMYSLMEDDRLTVLLSYLFRGDGVQMLAEVGDLKCKS